MKGFTLLELLVVLTIAAALAVLASAQLSRLYDLTALKSSAREMAAQLRQARSEAITRQQETLFELDLRRRASPRLEIELLTAASEIRGERRGAIRFFPDGSSTGGRVTLASGARRYVVDVDWLTGRVAIHE